MPNAGISPSSFTGSYDRVVSVSYTHLRDAILTGKDLHSTETLASHADWALKFMSKYAKIDESNICLLYTSRCV